MRRWVSGHTLAWFTIFGDLAVTHLTFGAPHPDLEDSQSVLESTIRKSARDQPLGWWAVVERASHTIIGTIGLNATPERGTAELGDHFRQTAWEKGYATEAVRAVVPYGFGPGGYQQSIACIHPENGASRRVLAKSGFQQIGAAADDGNHKEHFALMQHDGVLQG